MLPAVDLTEIVGAHQPYEARARIVAAQHGERVGGKPCAQPKFEIADEDARMIGDRARTGETFREGGHAARRLERVLRAHEPPDLIEIEKLERHEADMTVPGMRGIERAAEKSDATAGPGRPGIEAGSQGRTCPRPRTLYL